VPATQIELPLVKMYTLGLRFFIGRCHATRLLPEVMSLIREGRLDPARITTQVASWEDAPRAWLEPGIKLVVQR
jgi:threonine dehydrogenase-like Zn-dependent dehydrogenase